MTAIEILLILTLVPLVLIGEGYWLARMLPGLSAAERLAGAMLVGLAVVLWSVSVVNLALPLSGIWGAVCLLPGVFTCVGREQRTQLADDVLGLLGQRRSVVVIATGAVFLGGLLWPLLSRPDLVFYDGTGNHDAFFWITGAEHLKRQNYLQAPVVDAVNPLYYSVTAITGWHPTWGRIGAEGLLALVSNLAGASPLKLYVAATAALFAPWLAAVYLVARTFLVERFSPLALGAAVLCQPMFVFFHSNANLPNLLGALMGALAVVATARGFGDGGWGRNRACLVVLALSGHGLLCAYPEMAPAVVLPCLILGLRGGRTTGWRGAGAVAVAAGASLAANPATTLRAWNGFWCSLEAAGEATQWPDMFATVPPPGRLPAMVTLSVPMAHDLGAWLGAACGTVLLLATVLAVCRARDRFGIVAALAGIGVMLVYTLQSRFGYGWQKSMQFSAVMAAAVLPVGVVSVLSQKFTQPRFVRLAARAAAGAVALIFGYATCANGREAYKWSQRKFITWDWFEARDYSRRALRNAPVLVDAAGFSRPFFYTMWATYFLTDSRVYFTTGDPSSGGYLHAPLQRAAPERVPVPKAILVSANAAANSGRERNWGNGSVTLLVGQDLARSRRSRAIN